MDFTARLALLRFDGATQYGADWLYHFTDALTGSTFSIQPGETVGEGLCRFILRWQAALDRNERP